MRYTSDAAALAMQKEAQKRVLDMQDKGRRMTESANVLRPIEIPRLKTEEKTENEAPTEKSRPPHQRKNQGGDIRGIFEGLFSSQGQGAFSSLGDSLQKAVGSAASPATKLLDSFGIGGEELLILMVMYMVFKEHGDTALLLALGYLLI